MKTVFKYKFLIIVLSLIIKHNQAQNLVPNPSFELYDTCPYSASQVHFASPWKGVTTNSSDYFNSCSSTYTGVPRCGAGWQYARSGSAYAAIWAINGWGSNYREYLRVKLDSTLEQDSCYWVEFYCNVYNLSCFGIDKLGACITSTSINSIGPGLVLQTYPQIISNSALTDTLNWMRVSGYFKATGGEQFITIGNFNTDAATDTTNVRNSGCSGAYYLIDDVSITKISGCDTLNSSLYIQEQNQRYGIKLYPNPNNGNMVLEYAIKSTEMANFKLTDITGKTVEEYDLNSNSDRLEINDTKLNNGVYFYLITVNNKIVKQDKLIIIK